MRQMLLCFVLVCLPNITHAAPVEWVDNLNTATRLSNDHCYIDGGIPVAPLGDDYWLVLGDERPGTPCDGATIFILPASRMHQLQTLYTEEQERLRRQIEKAEELLQRYQAAKEARRE